MNNRETELNNQIALLEKERDELKTEREHREIKAGIAAITGSCFYIPAHEDMRHHHRQIPPAVIKVTGEEDYKAKCVVVIMHNGGFDYEYSTVRGKELFRPDWPFAMVKEATIGGHAYWLQDMEKFHPISPGEFERFFKEARRIIGL